MEKFYEIEHPDLINQTDNINKAIDILVTCYKKGGKILICGNGGSSADSSHIVAELMKGFMINRPLNTEYNDKINIKLQAGIPAIDLTAQTGIISAFANDVDPSLVFAQQVLTYGLNSKNDVVIGLSTSGNSLNVVEALSVAKQIGLKTIGFTGCKDSKISEIASVCIKAPVAETYKVQEYHLPIYHYICQKVEDILFKNN